MILPDEVALFRDRQFSGPVDRLARKRFDRGVASTGTGLQPLHRFIVELPDQELRHGAMIASCYHSINMIRFIRSRHAAGSSTGRRVVRPT